MGERTSYTPGTFCWADLATTDQEAAKQFYTQLFGWQANDTPMGEGAYYTMMQLGDGGVAAVAPQPQQQRESGAPPAWNSYISVESADATLDRASQLGATVHAPAFDVFDAGRMGVVQDPQGAFVLVWEPKGTTGASLVNAVGAISWNELATPDMEASAQFYSELFGWSVEPLSGSEMPYMTIKNRDGWNNGGIRPATPPGVPPHWLVYFGIDDVAAGLEKAQSLGGTQLVGSTDIGRGQIGVLQDPQGAAFALYAGLFED